MMDNSRMCEFVSRLRSISLVAFSLPVGEGKAKGKRQEAKGLKDFFLTLNRAM